MAGPTLRFLRAARVALAGAAMPMTLDGAAGEGAGGRGARRAAFLQLAPIEGPGMRAYLAVAGGFAAPEVLGSRATFALGGFGGHATGRLRTGDLLPLADQPTRAPDAGWTRPR